MLFINNNLYKACVFSAGLLLIVFSFNCGDSGNSPQVNSGTLSITNFKTLHQSTEGIYELWVSVETASDHGDNSYRSLGRFNIAGDGSLIDPNGNSFTPNAGKIANLNTIEDALVTIEQPGDNDTIPGNVRLLGGTKSVQGSSLVFDLSMEYSEILGSVAGQFPMAEAKYLLATPGTLDTTDFNRGVWFSLNTGGSNAGLTLHSIPDSLDWTYQAWVIDSRDSANYIYNIGRFSSSDTEDDNQLCRFNPPNSVWLLPGNEWITANCPGTIPDITDLNNGFYRLMITLEPRFEQGAAILKPFYIKLFYGSITPSSYGTVLTLPNYNSAVSKIPAAVLRLTTN